MFTEGLIDTELFWLSFGDLITYTVTATVIIIEVSFATWLLLKWLHGNININWSPTVNIGESGRSRVDSPVSKNHWGELDNTPTDMGPIEVGVKKNIILSDADESNIKSDEETKGKVKTQKDKLKKLRGR
tara:strand:- start:488 stop:877 length:390 start_codon:yes stop_codon:yes gene_type:complete